jgi:hypothetical protein
MPRYTIELFRTGDEIASRGQRDEISALSRDDLMALARDAVEKFGLVWGINDEVRAPTPSHVRILCDGAELLRVKVPSELTLQ